MPKFSHSKVENNITRKKEISNKIFISFPLHPIQEETKKFLGRSIAMLSTIWILIGGWFVVKKKKKKNHIMDMDRTMGLNCYLLYSNISLKIYALTSTVYSNVGQVISRTFLLRRNRWCDVNWSKNHV